MQFIARLCADYASAYRIAVIHYRAFPHHLSFATAFVALIAGLDALVPYLLREVANRFSSKDPTVAGYAIVLAGAYGLTWTAARVSEWMKNMMSAAVLSRCDAAFQHAMSDHLMRVEYGRLTALDIGRVVAIMTRSRNAFSTITFTFFWALGPTLLQLVFATVVLCQVADPVIGSAFLISMSALFALTCWLADRSKGAHADIFEADNQVTSHILERLTFALDIKLNDAYDREQSALRRLLRQYVHKTSSGSARLALLLAAQAFFAGLALTVLAVAAATRVAKGALTIGEYVMVVGYAVAVTMPFTTLAASLSEMKKSHLALNEGFDILELPLEAGHTVADFDRESPVVLSIEGVEVRVGEKTILQNVNLRADRHQVTAIVGPSAGGKSSIANLALGLLRPAAGTVRISGIDVSDIAVSAIAKEIGLVPQNPLILSGNLRENLILGCEEVPDDAFLMAIVDDLELASLRNEARGNLLDEPLGIQGKRLSGGERQRVALGRALARRPDVLILDESTASLDPAREGRILERVRRRVPTIIAITHREALWRTADRVYEVSGGRIRELNVVHADRALGKVDA